MLRFNWIPSIRRALREPNASCCACGRKFSSFPNNAPLFTLSTQVLSPAAAYFSYRNAYPYISRLNYATSRKLKLTIAKEEAAIESLTPEETAQVLKVVNEVQQAEDLLKYIIPKKKAEEVIKKKNENEDKMISSLDQLISIIGSKSSGKFLCSVLNKPIPVSMHAAMFPTPTPEEVSRISKALSIIVVGNRISWCLIQRLVNQKNESEVSVDSFQQATYPFKPRMHFLTLLEEMNTIIQQLPESELYIVEEYPATVPTPYMFNFQLQMAQAKSIILGLLTSRSKESKIISVKTVSVARMFNTYIGSEKVSGQYVIENLLINQRSPVFKISDSTIEAYKAADVKVKEGLSQAILLNFAYWKLTQQIRIP